MTAQIRVRDTGGTLRTVTRIRARDEAGNLRTITRIRMRDVSAILRTVWEALASTVSPATLSQSAATVTITTGTVTCTPAGTPPYTYSWVPEFSDGTTPTAPSSATTAFRHSGMLSGDTYESDWFCDVTDATGFTVRSSNSVHVTITRT